MADAAEKYFEWSRASESQGNLEGALRHIEDAIRRRPGETVFWSAKAQYLYDLEEYLSAVAAARTAVQLNSNNYHSWAIQGMALARLGEFRESAECYRRSIAIKEDVGVYTMLAAVEYEFDADMAVSTAKRALSIDPEWDEAKEVLKAAKKKLNE